MKCAALALVVAAACGGGTSSTDACKTTEVEVDYFKGSRAGEVDCEPIPASCGSAASCSDQMCIRDMYDLCAAPEYLGVGCSDTFPPTIISCNL